MTSVVEVMTSNQYPIELRSITGRDTAEYFTSNERYYWRCHDERRIET